MGDLMKQSRSTNFGNPTSSADDPSRSDESWIILALRNMPIPTVEIRSESVDKSADDLL